MYPSSGFCYAAIKATERWAEETKELLKSSFDSEENGAVERKIDCKVIMYDECNECNKHNKNDKHNNDKLMKVTKIDD